MPWDVQFSTHTSLPVGGRFKVIKYGRLSRFSKRPLSVSRKRLIHLTAFPGTCLNTLKSTTVKEAWFLATWSSKVLGGAAYTYSFSYSTREKIDANQIRGKKRSWNSPPRPNHISDPGTFSHCGISYPLCSVVMKLKSVLHSWRHIFKQHR
jgi:hypothetical protein